MSLTYDDALGWVRAFAGEVEANKSHLTKLDSAIGDGDHGTNMQRGMKAALAKVEEGDGNDIGALFKTIGMTLVSKVGGAAGPLYGTLFMQIATPLAGKSEVAPDEWAAAFAAGVEGVAKRGKAETGDKTMIDALAPARDALQEALDGGATFQEALERSAAAAKEGMESTTPLVARKGRASYLGERSAGHQDPGATSSHLLVQSAFETLKGCG
jgi:phosphoenolpyruvate---glycerone phosphotransferase subunit DhaL